jgi:hypothetical protein
MTPELLELLTDSERAAHARLTLDRAAYAVENGAADPTCASCGVPVHVRAGCDFEPGEDVCDSCAHLRNATNAANLRAALTTIATLRDHLRKQQEAFIIGLELSQRTADAEMAGLRATIAPYLAGIERGQGVPPVAGFSWCRYPDRWQYDDEVGRAGCRVIRIGGEWRYSWSFWRVGDPTEDPWPSGYASTAFACMIAAKAALDAWNIAHPYTPEPA